MKNAEKRSPIGSCFLYTSFVILLPDGFMTNQNTVSWGKSYLLIILF